MAEQNNPRPNGNPPEQDQQEVTESQALSTTAAGDDAEQPDRESFEYSAARNEFTVEGEFEPPSDEGLFDKLIEGPQIFDSKDVLRPSYTPSHLPHREEQINDIATILVSALRGNTPSNILVYGKTGSGKTASAKYVGQELEKTAKDYDTPCEVQYLNCEVTDTQYRVLARLTNTFVEQNKEYIRSQKSDLVETRSAIVDGECSIDDTEFETLEEIDAEIMSLEADLEEQEEVPFTGLPTDRVYNQFFQAVDYRHRVLVIMLDEIDKLVENSGDDTLYNLSRINGDLETSRVSIIGISNDLKFTDFLDPRVRSSLGDEEIVFPPYDASQLGDILEQRAAVAFKDDVIGDGVISLCAAFAAQEHGDARRALDLLRTAGEIAQRKQCEDVREEHVRIAQEKIELDRIVEAVQSLPTQSKLVLLSIILLEESTPDGQDQRQNINTGLVYNCYKQLASLIDQNQLTQRRVTDLISELDMLGIVNSVVVSNGRYGRTKEIGLSVPIEEAKMVLMGDDRIGDLDGVTLESLPE